MKIFPKLLLLFLSIGLLPLGIVSVISHRKSKQALEDNIKKNLISLNSEAGDEIDRLIARRLDDLKAWSASPVMNEIFNDDNEGLLTGFFKGI